MRRGREYRRNAGLQRNRPLLTGPGAWTESGLVLVEKTAGRRPCRLPQKLRWNPALPAHVGRPSYPRSLVLCRFYTPQARLGFSPGDSHDRLVIALLQPTFADGRLGRATPEY
jgi:hypothetical protein